MHYQPAPEGKDLHFSTTQNLVENKYEKLKNQNK